MTRPSPQQAALLQAVVDGYGTMAPVDDRGAAQACVAAGWLVADEDGYTLTLDGADALRATQGQSTTEQVLGLLALDARSAV